MGGEDVVEEMEVTVSVEGRVERVEKVNAADLKGEAIQAFDDFHLDEQRGRSANNKPGAAEEKDMVEVNMSVHLCEEVPKAKLISRFTFSPRECMGELDTLKMMMCSHANLGWEAEDLENY